MNLPLLLAHNTGSVFNGLDLLVIDQRVLAGKNQKESRRGSILAGYLKLTPVFIFLISGMIVFALFSTLGSGFTTAGNGDQAYTCKEGLATPDMLRAQYGVLFSLQQIHWLYYAEALLIVCIMLVFVISAFTKAPDPSTVRYTCYGAAAEEKAATCASWNHWDVIHSAIIVGINAVFYHCFW
jgi:hypothetical protein